MLHHKSHLLSFFLFMSKGNNKFESSHMWSIPKQVLHSNPISVSSKNQIGFLPDDSSAGVKKIYQSNLNRKMSNVSSRTHSGVSYTNSDSEIYKDQLTTSTSSSRSTSKNFICFGSWFLIGRQPNFHLCYFSSKFCIRGATSSRSYLFVSRH